MKEANAMGAVVGSAIAVGGFVFTLINPTMSGGAYVMAIGVVIAAIGHGRSRGY